MQAPCSGTACPVSVPRSETRLVRSPATLAMPPPGDMQLAFLKLGAHPGTGGQGSGEVWSRPLVMARYEGGQGAAGDSLSPPRAHLSPRGAHSQRPARSNCRACPHSWSRAVCSSAPRTSPTPAHLSGHQLARAEPKPG